MYKKLTILIMMVFIIFAGYNSNNESLIIFNIEQFNVPFNETELSRTITLKVYSNNSYVTKTVMIEKNTVVDGDNDDLNELETCAKVTGEAFESDKFQVDGFEYSIEISETSYTLVTTYDYSKINIKEELKKGKEFLHINGMIDNDYKIPYEKVKEAYTIMGYSCEEGQ